MALRGERPPIGLSWIVTWPLSAAFAALVFLSAEETRHPTKPLATTAPPPPVGGPDWAAHFPERIAAVDAALHKAALRLQPAVEDSRGSGRLRWTHRLYDVPVATGEEANPTAVLDALRDVDPGLTATAHQTADGPDVRVGLDGLLISTVRFRPAAALTPKAAKPRLTLVIGPLGDDLRVARQVVAIDEPVVLGVRPFRPFSREVAELGRLFQREVVVQLDGSEGLMAEAGEDGAPDLDAALATVPQALGIAWQARGGTGLPPDQKLMAEVQRRRLLYVGAARRSDGPGLPAPATLGGEPPEVLSAQLAAVAEKARSEGSAIAIGSPSDATLAALTQVLPEWRAADVEVVPLSALAPTVNLSAR